MTFIIFLSPSIYSPYSLDSFSLYVFLIFESLQSLEFLSPFRLYSLVRLYSLGAFLLCLSLFTLLSSFSFFRVYELNYNFDSSTPLRVTVMLSGVEAYFYKLIMDNHLPHKTSLVNVCCCIISSHSTFRDVIKSIKRKRLH